MAARYWVGDTDSDWNDTSNWASTTGGAGGAGVPTSSDDVTFDDQYTTKDCTCDVAIDVASLTIASTYDGTLDFGDLSYSHSIAGNFTCDGTGKVDCGDATITCGGDVDTRDQALWDSDASTWVLSGTAKTWYCNTGNMLDWNHVTVSGTITLHATTVGPIINTLTVSGTMTGSNNTGADYAEVTTLAGAGTITGNLAVQWNGPGSVITFNGTWSQTGLSASNSVYIPGGTTLLLPANTYSGDWLMQCPKRPFISTWTTTSASESITLPIESGGSYNFLVDWGDGSTSTVTTWDDTDKTHTYATASTYTVTIHGTITGFRFNNAGDKTKITTITQWGSLRLGNGGGYFFGCGNLTIPASDKLDMTGTTNMSYMFYDCSAFNQSVSSFDTAAVTSMFSMFYGCTAFNQSISSFDTAAVTNMGSMFRSCTAFNQSVSSFNTAAVTSMGSMFYGCTAFNQSVSSFNTAAVTSMGNMFRSCSAFNQSVSSFNTAAVTSMVSMFYGCTAFNQSVSSFNTAAVTSMSYMFFICSAFNQSVSSFDTAAVTSMSNMFRSCSAFNQSVSSFDVSLVTTMDSMFFGANALSTANYDALLIAWEGQTVKSSVPFHAGDATYSAGSPATARAALISADLWTITDGGPA